jgi:hypothetical protein
MTATTASGKGPQITPDEASELMSAHDRMLARHKLIEGMIHNNELQLKNESARGGAEIERACALRNLEADSTDAQAQSQLAELNDRLRVLEDEHRRLVTEREWLNTSLLEFENDPSAHGHHQAGHA